MTRRIPWILALALLGSLLGGAATAGAQLRGVDTTRGASPLIPGSHWSHHATRRLQAAGLLPSALPPRSATSGRAMAHLLAMAAAEATEGGSPLAPLADGWLQRLLIERPELAEGAPHGVALLHGAGGASIRRERGLVSPGRGEFPPDRTGPAPRDAPAALQGELDLAVALGSRISLEVGPRLDSEGVRVAHGDLSASFGVVSLAVGRQEVGYAYAVGGSPVLTGATFDRVQIATARPLEPPRLLSFLGPVTFHTFLSRLDDDRHPGPPYFWGASGAVHPHPRFAIQVNRAAMIGGDGITDPITPFALLKGLVGKHSGVENQIVSVQGRLRLPTERILPLTAYCEFGSEDSSGSFYRVPGLVCGGFAPLIPGVTGLSAGVEGAYIGEKCCGNPGWYRHRQFLGAWATEDAPLGHPLGGQGSEVKVYGSFDGPRGRLSTRASAFQRHRGPENLFVPGLGGDSFGLEAALLVRFGARGEVQASAAWEDGVEWSEERFLLSSRIYF